MSFGEVDDAPDGSFIVTSSDFFCRDFLDFFVEVDGTEGESFSEQKLAISIILVMCKDMYRPCVNFLFRLDFRREVSGTVGEVFPFSPVAPGVDLNYDQRAYARRNIYNTLVCPFRRAVSHWLDEAELADVLKNPRCQSFAFLNVWAVMLEELLSYPRHFGRNQKEPCVYGT